MYNTHDQVLHSCSAAHRRPPPPSAMAMRDIRSLLAPRPREGEGAETGAPPKAATEAGTPRSLKRPRSSGAAGNGGVGPPIYQPERAAEGSSYVVCPACGKKVGVYAELVEVRLYIMRTRRVGRRSGAPSDLAPPALLPLYTSTDAHPIHLLTRFRRSPHAPSQVHVALINPHLDSAECGPDAAPPSTAAAEADDGHIPGAYPPGLFIVSPKPPRPAVPFLSIL